MIDGQQRFSTLMLLLTALYDKLSEHKAEMDDDDQNDLANLRCELANKKRQNFIANGQKENRIHTTFISSKTKYE